MIKLNLLPEKVRAAERMQLIVLVGSGVYVLGLVFLGWLWMSAKAKVSAVESDIASVQAQLNAPELREAVLAVDRFTRDEKEKNEKASIVNTLRKRQMTLLRLVDAVPDWMMEGQVWLNTLEVRFESNERRVFIDGAALNSLVFARFFTNLESQPVVKKIKLVNPPSSGQDRGRAVVKFKVSFALEDYQ